ncbi:MAG: DegT/DnrJ/EryC1/StrS family aminotransferase [Actinomycetia bacterium]|nr:DegT/DnrJ/EryC1/StrS family aminotransferase [Actinomycetes bacterium]
MDAPIPLVDLVAQQAEIADEVRPLLEGVLRRAAFVGGPEVQRFESDFADYLGAAHCVAVANGTDAIEIALRAVGVGPGSEVILPANTFIATAGAVVRAGALPVLVDVDDEYLLMDPLKVADAVTPRTRAVVPVHLFGQAAPVEKILGAIDGSGIVVVEDAAQSQGARRHGQACGTLGSVAGTSFYPGKNLGAAGDAGAIVTDDAEVARLSRLLANHGSARKYVHEVVGFNSRLDTVQAVILSAKLARLDKWNQARRDAAQRYDRLLADAPGVRLPQTMPGNEHVWHLYVVRVPGRDRVLEYLHERGIGAGIHYPQPVHLTDAFRNIGIDRVEFPVSERAAEEILTLPLFPHVTVEQQERVVSVLREALVS